MTTPNFSDIAKEVQENPFFVGSQTLLNKVDWEVGEGKNIDCLVVRRAPDDDTDASSEQAVLTVVGRISEEKCKLLPCGGWTDRFGGELADAKAGFVLVSPRQRDLLPLWERVLEAVAKLQDSKRSVGASIQNSIIVKLENSTARGLKFRHTLYQPLDASSDGSDTATEDSAKGTERWNDATWPCQSSSAKNALAHMLEEKTHEPVAFPAYDAEGKLIAPADWMQKLQPGADVLVKFTVTHQWFGRAAVPDTKKDNYYADIDEIRVLKSARPMPTTPRKRARDDTNHAATESPAQKPKRARNN